ncbi:hypothetical protein GF358_02080 [Candidatus Woesearchaeota archaeon]|nr:hypothetical protein [Candidatus Woesearchaeota archaeon]
MHTYMHVYMTKVISLSDDAYDALKSIKDSGESFSEIIRKLAKKDILDFFGKWPGPKKELSKISRELKKERKGFKTREVKI